MLKIDGFEPLRMTIEISTKSKKSPPPYILDHNFRLRRRIMFPFAFADRYDPDEA